jgi:hypothetical protein
VREDRAGGAVGVSLVPAIGSGTARADLEHLRTAFLVCSAVATTGPILSLVLASRGRSNDSIVVTRTGAATGRVTRDRPLLESGQAICDDPALISVVHVHDRLAEERSVELDEVDRLAASEHGLAVLDREDDLHAE